MHDQPKYIPLRPTDFFADDRSAGRSSRAPWPAAISNDDTAVLHRQGPRRQAGRRRSRSRSPRNVIQRGEERYNIYCSPCHDRLGNGDGMIVRRGLPPAAVLSHRPSPRRCPTDTIYDVITNGFGAMPGLCGADSAARPLGHRGLHARAPVEPERVGQRRAGRRARPDCRREARSDGARHWTSASPAS